ncbi:MAG TPA: hypothetical protein DIT49_02320 [Clostridiales bacterium]|nr:hypothetical protein [Clostridiales bacterium]
MPLFQSSKPSKPASPGQTGGEAGKGRRNLSQIDLASLLGGKKKRQIASKTSLNLVVVERGMSHPTRFVPALAAIVLAAVLLGKLGVADRLDRLAAAEAEVQGIWNQSAALDSRMADYDQVEEEYNRYTYMDYDRTIIDRLDILDLVERQMLPVCTVQGMSISGSVMTLRLSGLTLEATAALSARLEEEKIVSSVTVSTSSYVSSTGSGEVITITNMTIALADATTLEEDGAQSADQSQGQGGAS